MNYTLILVPRASVSFGHVVRIVNDISSLKTSCSGVENGGAWVRFCLAVVLHVYVRALYLVAKKRG